MATYSTLAWLLVLLNFFLDNFESVIQMLVMSIKGLQFKINSSYMKQFLTLNSKDLPPKII